MNDLFWLTILLFVVAAALRSDLFFYLLYVVVGLQVLARLWLRRGAGHLSWRRRAPATAFLGEQMQVELELTNTGLLPMPWLVVSESLPPALRTPPLIREVVSLGAGERRVLSYSLVAQRRGGLILTSSGAGFVGTGWVAGYSAAKAYDLALAEALWWEWRPHGVDVLALCPGSTATPGMLGNAPRLDAAAMARPEDVAREALDALGQGPVCIPGEDNRRARAALERLPRRQLVELMGEQTRKLFTG